MLVKRLPSAIALALVAGPVLAGAAFAQQQPGVPYAQPAQGQPKAQAKSQATPAAKAAPKESAGGGSDAQLRQRVEQLEEQLVDMQVVVGTLESLARSGGGAAAAGSGGSPRAAGGASLSAAEAGRLDGLETQIRALTAQLEQLADQVRALQGRQGAAPPPVAPNQRLGAGNAEPTPRFGMQGTSPLPRDGDAIGGLINEDRDQQPPPRVASGGAAEGGNPKQLYEAAYGYLLQQDYGAAEAAFTEFLQRFPQDQLAGNAQYWLGESYYVRGNYKSAASAFLKGYQTYARSAKAPESLLKLAMSLDRLGQRDAACSSYSELGTRFPNAPAHVKSRAQSERARIGCV